jgi:hypothetical protein
MTMKQDDGDKTHKPSGSSKASRASGEAAQIIVDAVRRHVPTASRDQAEATAKDAVEQLEKSGKLNPS